MRIKRATVGWIVIACVLLVATALLSGRSNDDAGPDGFLALKRTLRALGADLADADQPPDPPATFVLRQDFRDSEEAGELLRWVEQGGTLVLMDPESLLYQALGVAGVGRVGGAGTKRLSASCAIAETAGLEPIVSASTDLVLAGSSPNGVDCFPAGEGSFVVAIHDGPGRIVLHGGSSIFTNRYLREGDAAVYAARLMGSGVVRFGPPLPPGSTAAAERSAWAALPDAGRAIVLQLSAAILFFAFARGRRIGKPKPEVPLVAIPAGELVRAEARLLRGARARSFAAAAMRGFVERRLGARGRSSIPFPETQARTDDELIAYGGELESFRKRVEDEEEA